MLSSRDFYPNKNVRKSIECPNSRNNEHRHSKHRKFRNDQTSLNIFFDELSRNIVPITALSRLSLYVVESASDFLERIVRACNERCIREQRSGGSDGCHKLLRDRTRKHLSPRRGEARRTSEPAIACIILYTRSKWICNEFFQACSRVMRSRYVNESRGKYTPSFRKLGVYSIHISREITIRDVLFVYTAILKLLEL